MEKSIELDCAPGGIRPDALIAEVMKSSGVEYDGRQPISRFFGNWKWDFSDIPDATWNKASAIFKERIEKLYSSGIIRYGSW